MPPSVGWDSPTARTQQVHGQDVLPPGSAQMTILQCHLWPFCALGLTKSSPSFLFLLTFSYILSNCSKSRWPRSQVLFNMTTISCFWSTVYFNFWKQTYVQDIKNRPSLSGSETSHGRAAQPAVAATAVYWYWPQCGGRNRPWHLEKWWVEHSSLRKWVYVEKE